MTADTSSNDSIEWTTDSGSDVTVTAEGGTLYVSLDGTDETGAGVQFERQRATLTVERGTDVLDAGTQRDDSGERFRALVPVEVDVEDVEALREASEISPTDEPLRYEVVEREESKPSLDGWGGGTRTVQTLSATKDAREMTDRQTELHRRVDAETDVPDEADPGDVLAVDELLDDPRTAEEREQDAVDEAVDTGEEVVISESTTDCDDSDRECSLDRVTRVATPDGEVETRRVHTH